MILSEAAATLANSHKAPFDLDNRAPVVAYVDAIGHVFCPEHRDYGRGELIPQYADNSAADDACCDGAFCGLPIAVVMLAARSAVHAAQCLGCRRAFLNHAETPARPCLDHLTHPAEILQAMVDGTPMPAPPWTA